MFKAANGHVTIGSGNRMLNNRCLMSALLLCLAQECVAGNIDLNRLTDVHSGKENVVVVHEDVVRQLPNTFFGFNQEVQIFETDSYNIQLGAINQTMLRFYRDIPGAVFRYPGGLMANHFNWEWAMGDRLHRRPQKLAEWAQASPTLFGPQEYFAFLKDVKGIPWYTLNLNGWNNSVMSGELPSDVVAASNNRLASIVATQSASELKVHYYQLGNELDRSEYEWPTAKYVQRAKDTIQAVSIADPKARFVAFLRDFNLKYHTRPGGSPYKQFMTDVFAALPMVEDISFQYYYDYPKKDQPRTDLPKRLSMFKEAIHAAAAARGGRMPRVWVTEHGRSSHPDIKGAKANSFTAGLGGAIAAADFWIATAQMPAIQGAFLYSVGHWNMFQTIGNGVYPMPMYWSIRILKQINLPNVLATETTSRNDSDYIGGYDIRAVAFTDDSRTRYGLWATNRAHHTEKVTLKLAALAGKQVQVREYRLLGREGVVADIDTAAPRVEFDLPMKTMLFDSNGALVLELPTNSVSSFHLDIIQQ